MPSATRLMLVTPPVEDALAMRATLEAMLAAADVAAVLLTVAGTDERQSKRIIQALAPVIQDRGAALLIQPPSDLRDVARAGADGVQLDGSAAIDDAVAALKPDRIIGVSGLALRDDAMMAGEKDVDYLMFGEPRSDGSVPSLEQVIERCAWWAEVFEVPCVAYVPSAEAVAPLAGTGAEFVALGPWAFEGDAVLNIRHAASALDLKR